MTYFSDYEETKKAEAEEAEILRDCRDYWTGVTIIGISIFLFGFALGACLV